MRYLKLSLVSLILAAAAGCGVAEAQSEKAEAEPRTISVNGSGAAAAAPDVAVITVGVESFAKTAEAAMTDNSSRSTGMIDALKELGVESKDIQTRNLNLHAQYDHQRPKDGSEPPRVLLGYRASNVVSARITNMQTVGQAIDAAIKAGGNRVDSIQFEISDPTSVLNAARDAAWENAHAKASQLAALAGAELGPVVKIESYEHTPTAVREVAMMRTADAAPVEPGQQQMSVQINVVWRLLSE